MKLDAYLAQFKEETIGIAFHDSATGDELFIHADEPFHPASTFKVAVMMEVYNQVRKGLFFLDDQIPIVNMFESLADGSPFSLLPEDDADTSLYEKIGRTASAAELVRLMIVRSSNLATNILVDKVSAGCVNALLKELGVDGVQVLRGVEDSRAHALGMDNNAMARGLMQIMILLAEGRVVSPGASAEMIRIMLGQEFNEGIPAGLPRETRVAHKTGWNGRTYHDFGLILPVNGKPYVLAVMTHGFEKEADAHACVARISELIYEEHRR